MGISVSGRSVVDHLWPYRHTGTVYDQLFRYSCPYIHSLLIDGIQSPDAPGRGIREWRYATDGKQPVADTGSESHLRTYPAKWRYPDLFSKWLPDAAGSQHCRCTEKDARYRGTARQTDHLPGPRHQQNLTTGPAPPILPSRLIPGPPYRIPATRQSAHLTCRPSLPRHGSVAL